MIEEVRCDALDVLKDLKNGTGYGCGKQPIKYQLILDQIIEEIKVMHLTFPSGPEEE